MYNNLKQVLFFGHIHRKGDYICDRSTQDQETTKKYLSVPQQVPKRLMLDLKLCEVVLDCKGANNEQI